VVEEATASIRYRVGAGHLFLGFIRVGSSYYAAVQGILKECWRLGLGDADSYRAAVDVESVRGST